MEWSRVDVWRPGRRRGLPGLNSAEALPEVTETLIREAKKGSVQHLKLLVTICGLNLGGVAPEPKKHPGRNLEQILMDEWKKDKRSGEAVGEQ
jgi:hypothetical protein